MVSAYPMSSGRLGPASRAPSCRRRRNDRQAARPGQKVDGLADHGLLERGPGRVPRAVALPRVQFHAQPDQVPQRVHVDVARSRWGPSPRRTRCASAASPSSQAPSFAPVSDGGGAVRGPPGPDLRGPFLLQRRVAVEPEQVGQARCAPRPSPAARPAPAACPLATRRRIASASASWYRCSWVRSSSAPAGADSASSTLATTAAHSGVRSPVSTPAPWNVVSSRTPRSANPRAGSSSGRSDAGPLVHLGEQRGQVRQPQPGRGGLHQQLVGLLAVLLRQPVRPPADRPPPGLRQLPGGQRRDHRRMRPGPVRPRGMGGGRAAGDPGLVHQPGPRAVIRVGGVALARGERGQERRPRRGGDRVGLLQPPQARGLGLGVRAARRPRRRGTPARRAPSRSPRRRWRRPGLCPSGSPPSAGSQGWSGQVSRFSVRSYRPPTTFPGTNTQGREIGTKELKRVPRCCRERWFAHDPHRRRLLGRCGRATGMGSREALAGCQRRELIFSATLVLVHLASFTASRRPRWDMATTSWYSMGKVTAGAGLLVRANTPASPAGVTHCCSRSSATAATRFRPPALAWPWCCS